MNLQLRHENNVEWVSGKGVKKTLPESLLRISRTFNLVNSVQLKELYGVDRLHE